MRPLEDIVAPRKRKPEKNPYATDVADSQFQASEDFVRRQAVDKANERSTRIEAATAEQVKRNEIKARASRQRPPEGAPPTITELQSKLRAKETSENSNLEQELQQKEAQIAKIIDDINNGDFGFDIQPDGSTKDRDGLTNTLRRALGKKRLEQTWAKLDLLRKDCRRIEGLLQKRAA